MTQDRIIEDAITAILKQIGEDSTREGLANTPERVARMYQEICCGYNQDLKSIVHGAIFSENTEGMVLIRDISFYSLCEHHMLPFFGNVHVAYIPNGKIIGLSKIPRIVEMYARRLQVQERLTEQIAAAIQSILEPSGIAVMLEAQHLCAMMRGVRKENAHLVTCSFTGAFKSDSQFRNEFFASLRTTSQDFPEAETNS